MIPVFYRPEQNAPVTSYSPSSDKPRQVVADWVTQDIEVQSFHPVTRHELYLAHDPAYVDGVLNLDIANGFGNYDPKVANSLIYTTGSMLAAAEHAVLHQTIACSPTSGFHHAGYDFGGGFCTFNGLMVTAMKLKKGGLVNTVGILDCDMHYGNGTDDIIKRLGIDWIKHHTFGKHFTTRDSIGSMSKRFYEWMEKSIADAFACDLVLYQAGADPHIQDPLGGLLTDKQMFHRDRMVFEQARGIRKPLAWNLAGGYRRDANDTIKPVLKTHMTTLKTCLSDY
jgi:acetoin utilization deacetylase AcuC-like enzyme